MKNIKLITCLSLMLVTLFGCEYEKANQDVAGITLDGKANVSVMSNVAEGDINEGESIDLTINFSNSVNKSVTFNAVLKSGDASSDDLVLGSGTVAAYTTSTTLSIEVKADLIPELDENAILTIEAASPADFYYVHPNSNIDSFEYNIKSPVDPDDLIVALEWDTHASSDLDMFSVSAINGAWDQQWTADHPEVKNLIWGSDPDGTYYLGIDPYTVEDSSNGIWYRWSLGQPDGTVTIIEGTFDYDNRDTVYTIDTAAGNTASYRLVTVEKTGTTFVATSSL